MKKILLLLPLLLATGAPARAQQALLPQPEPLPQPELLVVRPRGIVLRDTATARAVAVSGTVREAGGPPLPGVTVLVKGTRRGTSTDAQGHYLLLGARRGAGHAGVFHGGLRDGGAAAGQKRGGGRGVES